MNTKNSLNKNWKSPKIIFTVFVFFIAILFIQYAYLAISPNIYGTNMDKFAANRNTISKTLAAERGKIYDVEGNVLALDVSSYTVIAYLSESRTSNPEKPRHVVDVNTTAKLLAPLINMSEEYLYNLLKNGKDNNLYQVELGPGGRDITELKKEEIEALNLPGIGFVESKKRSYPNGNFASYTIGYAKMNEVKYTDDKGNETTKNEIVGELGIEAKYDEILKGKTGFTTYQQDRFGYKIPDTPETTIAPEDGADIYLTINSNIQRFLEDAVKDVEANYDPEWMMITVMDAKTGDILGTSSSPSFDPNIRDIENYENPLVTYEYEPGSTMKIYTYMCAMENGKYDGNATYLSGEFKFDQDKINDWNGVGWGYITYDLGFQFSSNVAIANIMQNYINKNDLRECLDKYGFGKKTDIELPREMTGNLKFTYPIEVATAGFGQGISITGVQQLQALTMIANNGKMLKPHIIDKIVNPTTKEIIYESKTELSEEQIVSEATIAKMKQLMHNTMYGTEAGTSGNKYGIEGYDLIGKTGTGQIFDTSTGQYLEGANNYVFSFAGMFPGKDPEVIIYAVLKRPKRGAGMVLVNSTRQVIQNVAKYLNIYGEDEEDKTVESLKLESYISKNTEEVEKQLTEKGIKVIKIGTGDKIIDQYPAKGYTLLAGDKLFIKTNSLEYKMPNLIGLTRKDVITISNMLKLNYEINGYGSVKNQSITENQVITNDMVLTVELYDKYEITKPKEEAAE